MSEDNTLGPYHLLRRLGEGGMGTVYLAHDPALDRRVAVKVLRLPASTSDAKAGATMARRFLREARSAARISHPHVVTIHAVGEHPAGGGRPYLVMEYVEGGSLADHLRRQGPLGWREVAAALRDALRALAAAHAQGVIHRDIKPANLMRGRNADGSALVKLVDFGLARVVSDGPLSDELTFPGAFVGSPSYASPEQIAGTAVDGRADLYSLAATGFALLTGQPPFVEDDPADVLQHHLERPFPDVRSLAPAVPGALVEILDRASRKRAADRYPTAAAMLGAVEALLAIPATDPAVPATAARSRRGSRLAPERPVPEPSLPTPTPSSAQDTVAELETRLARARMVRDSSTQLQTLRTLYGLYAQLQRPADATRAYREALALHIKMHAPHSN